MRYDLGGTIRAATPATTLSRLEDARRAVGITRVANVTGLDRVGIPVALCIRPNSRHLSVSQGKGITDDLAVISSIMESIEGFHAENPPPPDIQSSLGLERDGIPFLDPSLLLPGFRWSALEVGHALQWIRATDLVTRSPIFLPHVCVDLDSSRPHPDIGVIYTSSNGLASGNTTTEAILHAIFEIVERDAEERWLELAETDQDARRIPLWSIDDPMLQSILEKFKAAGLAAAVWNTTSRTELPSFRCVLSETSIDRDLASFHGSGCHLNKAVAMARALTEAAQTRLTLITGSRDDLTPREYVFSAKNVRPPPLDHHAGTAYTSIQAHPSGNSLEDDLECAVNLIVSAGFRQIAVVDLTRPDLEIPVVFASIPGARFNGMRF